MLAGSTSCLAVVLVMMGACSDCGNSPEAKSDETTSEAVTAGEGPPPEWAKPRGKTWYCASIESQGTGRCSRLEGGCNMYVAQSRRTLGDKTVSDCTEHKPVHCYTLDDPITRYKCARSLPECEKSRSLEAKEKVLSACGTWN